MSTATETSAARYAKGSVILHWLIALLIALNYVAAWVSEDMPKEQAAQIMGNHKAFGITILVLTVVRIIWRLTHPAPPLSESLKAWEAKLAKAAHGLLYLLMLAIPASGWAMSSAWTGGEAINIFGLFGWPGLPFEQSKELAHTLGEGHEVMATAMLVLMAIHVIGALKHQFVDKDRNALARMTMRKP